MASYFKNWKADRANGKLKVTQQRVDDQLNGVRRSPEKQKALDKELFKLGVLESKTKRLNDKPQVVVKKTNISKNDHRKQGVIIENSKVLSENTKRTDKKGSAKN